MFQSKKMTEPFDRYLLKRVFNKYHIIEFWATRCNTRNKISSSTHIYKMVLKKNDRIYTFFDNFDHLIYGIKF